MFYIRNCGKTLKIDLGEDGIILFLEDGLIKTKDQDLMYQIVDASEHITMIEKNDDFWETESSLPYVKTPEDVDREEEKLEQEELREAEELIAKMGLTGNLDKFEEDAIESSKEEDGPLDFLDTEERIPINGELLDILEVLKNENPL